MNEKQIILNDHEIYKLIFQRSLDGILLTDAKSGRILMVNKAICRMFGYSDDELMKMRKRDLYPENVREKLHGQFQQHITGTAGMMENTPIKRKDGQLLYADITVQQIKIKNQVYNMGFFRDVTARKTTEDRLKILSMVVEQNSSDIAILDEQGKVEFANKTLLQRNQIEEKDFIGKDWQSVTSDDSTLKKDIDRIRKTVLKEGAAWVGEVEDKRKDGRPVWRQVMIFPIMDESGQIIRLVYCSDDITERKQAGEALKQSQRLNDSIMVSTRSLVYIFDLVHKKITYANTDVARVLGYSQDDIFSMGASFLDKMIHPDDLTTIFGYLDRWQTVSDSDILSSEWRLRDKNGRYHWFYSRDTVYKRSNHGDVVEIMGVAQDITEKKLAEQALRASEARLKTTVESLPFEFFALDENGYYILQNAICKKHGGDVIGKRPGDVAPNDKLRHLWNENNRKAYSGETVEGDVSYKVKGKTVYMHNIISPVLDGDRVCGIVGVNIDITQRVMAAQQIQKDLAEKEALLKEIFHRVKNNLNVISSLLSLQSRKIKTKKQALEAFGETRDRIYAMALVHEKLYHSRDFTHIDMKPYIENMVHDLLQVYGERDSIHLNMNIRNIYLDINTAIPCGLILNELVTNTFKHAFPGDKKGKLGIRFMKSRNKTYQLIVEDNGIGIQDDMNVESSDSFGLQLISMLVKQIDGDMVIQKAKGTRFEIVFPEPSNG